MRLTRRLLLSSAALIPGAALAQPAPTSGLAPHRRKPLYGPRGGKFGPQDLGGTLPTSDISFVSGTLDPRVTFTRASSATYFDVNGTLQTAPNNVARLDYDPIAHTPRGLLIEEARTNLVVASGAMGAAPWTAASPTTWGPPGADPAGTTNAALFIPANVTAIHQVYSPAITIAAGATYCLSCFVKAAGQRYGGLQLAIAGNGTGFRVGWDTATGAITIAVAFGTGTVAASGIQACPNGWFRVWVIGTVSATDTSVFCIYAPVAASGNAPTASQPGDGVNGQYFWGAQVEAGTFLTSYIPTAAASVARAVDAASIAGNYAQNGSLVSDFTLTNPAANTVVASIGKAATLSNDALTLRSFGALPATMQGISFASNVNSGGVQTSNTYAQGTNAKLGMTYTPTAMTVCLNAGTVAPAVLTAIPATLDTISVAIGRLVATGTGWTRRIRYWNRVLSNAELQQVTT